jgi:hypothetical protein
MCIDPPLPFHAAAFLAVQLGHDRLGRDSFDHRLHVIAICGDDHVSRFKRHHRADCDRFLSDIEMTESADLTHAVNLGAFLFEASAEDHLIKHRSERFLVGLLYRLELRLATFLILGFRELDDGEIDVSVLRRRFRTVIRCRLGFCLCFSACSCLCQNRSSVTNTDRKSGASVKKDYKRGPIVCAKRLSEEVGKQPMSAIPRMID